MIPIMRRLRIFEAAIVIIGSFLALRTFFEYPFISNKISFLYIFIITIYLADTLFTLILASEGSASLFLLNLLLYLPAALSLSELNWTFYYRERDPMALGRLTMSSFRTSMPLSELLAIGLVLVAGVVLLPLINKLKEEARSIVVRGDRGKIEDIFSQNAKLVSVLFFASLSVTIIVSIIVEIFNGLLG